MAGVTTCSFKPSASPNLRPKPASSSLCSPFLLRLPPPGSGRGSTRTAVTARFGRGGGGGYRPGGGGGMRRAPRENRRDGLDSDDEALDLSRITSTSIRLIDEQQNMVGVVSKSEAIKMAEDAERDLVILSADADPPVLRIMDYNKFKYEQQKKKRDQQKKSAATRMDIKELKMGYNIDSHDYTVRLKAAQKFLKEGDKVKIIVNLKGRENEFRSIAIELIKRFQDDIGELATEESKSFRERNVFIVLVPNKSTAQKDQEQQKKTGNTVSAIVQ